jgi:hypothetical protein
MFCRVIDTTHASLTVCAWDPASRQCWLKKLSNPYQPVNINPAIAFTSGAVYPLQPRYVPPASGSRVNGSTSREDVSRSGSGVSRGGVDVSRSDGDGGDTPAPYCLHTMITSNGQPYMNWQTRVRPTSQTHNLKAILTVTVL